MLDYALIAAFTMITTAMVLNLYRLITGPSKPDRILALDTLYINSIALLITLSLYLKTATYFEAALLIAVMGFVGTVGFSKYILRGDIME